MHGYTNAIWFAVGILVLAATVAATLINTGRPDVTSASGEGAGEGAEDEVKVPVIAH